MLVFVVFSGSIKIAQEKTQASYPDEMQDSDGQKLKTNQEKADAFAKTFAKKTEKLFRK